MLSPENVTVSLYRSPQDFDDFRCEKQGYADFVQKPNEALRYYSENLGVTYVFRFNDKALGFVTLAMSALQRRQLSKERKEQKPFRDVPSLLLGHMARDKSLKGQGTGKIMIDWVLSKALELAGKVGCRFVIVDSEKDVVERYRKHGFEMIPPCKSAKTCLMFFDLGIRAGIPVQRGEGTSRPSG
jgi:GNAT superfamily N-acetyltransferase